MSLLRHEDRPDVIEAAATTVFLTPLVHLWSGGAGSFWTGAALWFASLLVSIGLLLLYVPLQRRLKWKHLGRADTLAASAEAFIDQPSSLLSVFLAERFYGPGDCAWNATVLRRMSQWCSEEQRRVIAPYEQMFRNAANKDADLVLTWCQYRRMHRLLRRTVLETMRSESRASGPKSPSCRKQQHQ